MQLVNYHCFDKDISAGDVFSFVKYNYEFVDVIEIDFLTLICELIRLDLINQNCNDKEFCKRIREFFRHVFSNEHYKNDYLDLKTPQIAEAIYNYIQSKYDNPPPTFLNICYYYDIPLLLTDANFYKNVIFDFPNHHISIDDTKIHRALDKDYITNKYRVKGTKDKFHLGVFNAIYDYCLSKNFLHGSSLVLPCKDKEKANNILKDINNKASDKFDVFTPNSLKYLYNDLIGV